MLALSATRASFVNLLRSTALLTRSLQSSSTVRHAKQQWLFVPVGGNAAAAPSPTDSVTSTTAQATVENAAVSIPLNNGNTNNNKSSCGKTQAWIQRHPNYVRQVRFSYQPCCIHDLKSVDSTTILNVLRCCGTTRSRHSASGTKAPSQLALWTHELSVSRARALAA